MSRETYINEVLQFWSDAIANIAGDNPPMSATWRGVYSIRSVLQPFVADERNHAYLPTGGGWDMRSVDHSVELGCLDFGVGERAAWIMKPNSLVLENFPETPINSFLLLELAELQPSGIYEHRETRRAEFVEELVELGPGDYAERGVWDDGFLGRDEEGNEIPLPDNSRLVNRWLKGKILIVAKTSLWNSVPATYDGRHNTMEANDIRRCITEALAGSEK